MPPASCTIRAIFVILRSKRPTVFGFVIMMPATVSSRAAASALRSILPSRPEGIVLVTKPAIVQEAGLVPWAESGISIVVRWVWPLARR